VSVTSHTRIDGISCQLDRIVGTSPDGKTVEITLESRKVTNRPASMQMGPQCAIQDIDA
jgi:hypothetical protein